MSGLAILAGLLIGLVIVAAQEFCERRRLRGVFREIASGRVTISVYQSAFSEALDGLNTNRDYRAGDYLKASRQANFRVKAHAYFERIKPDRRMFG